MLRRCKGDSLPGFLKIPKKLDFVKLFPKISFFWKYFLQNSKFGTHTPLRLTLHIISLCDHLSHATATVPSALSSRVRPPRAFLFFTCHVFILFIFDWKWKLEVFSLFTPCKRLNDNNHSHYMIVNCSESAQTSSQGERHDFPNTLYTLNEFETTLEHSDVNMHCPFITLTRWMIIWKRFTQLMINYSLKRFYATYEE